jgi:outer membrane receptor for ferrienterochelin and colicins
MKTIYQYFIFNICFLLPLLAQHQPMITGEVVEKNETGSTVPIAGANVYWFHGSGGTTTDNQGKFQLLIDSSSSRLIVRCIGYMSDTVFIGTQHRIQIELKSEATLIDSVEVVGTRQTAFLDYNNTKNTLVMTEKELFKAACCNLSESFETNPSIDVSFTDAITGTKQIEMLGLAGTYSQITTENIPSVRGLMSNVGLSYIPGTWIESIQLSKGVGSVANGYESITGQINVELRKPTNKDEKLLFINLYSNQDQRIEANFNYRQALSEYLSSMTLFHMSSQKHYVDANSDRFLDLPLGTTFNFLQRFQLSGWNQLESQINIQLVNDEKNGGTEQGVFMDRNSLLVNPREYSFGIHSRYVRLTGKTGYVFPESTYQSIGLQYAYTESRQVAFFEFRQYDGTERSGYLNLLYQTELGSHAHIVRLGASFMFDSFDEVYELEHYNRIERVPGIFAEYTFNVEEKLSLVAGLRVDNHNLFGTFTTPRLHIRYTPEPDWVIRAVAGKGQRTANIYAENMAYFASARSIHAPSFTNGYPFQQEIAWNYGLNLTHYFIWDDREATISVDAYRTIFKKQVVIDLDRNPQEVFFYNLDGTSYSNSLQVELNIQPVERFDTRMAYRFLDVKQTIDGTLLDKPFVARHRAFVNFGYSTERDEQHGPQMLYDLTIQWFGRKRLPETFINPTAFQVSAFSQDFFLVNAQITRSFFATFDLYLGIENLLDFRQKNPIIDAANPNDSHFDSSFIWGPVSGRLIYIGLRWKM